MTERKLVEAFKAFFEKSVLPHNSNNDILLNDWRHFQKIISSDPVDSNQLDFFIYMINKQGSSPNFTKPPPERQTTANISDFSKFGKVSNDFSNLQEKKNPLLGSSGHGSRRKDLLRNLENFQSLLLKNQEKLQSYNRSGRETSFNTSITSNGGGKKYY